MIVEQNKLSHVVVIPKVRPKANAAGEKAASTPGSHVIPQIA